MAIPIMRPFSDGAPMNPSRSDVSGEKALSEWSRTSFASSTTAETLRSRRLSIPTQLYGTATNGDASVASHHSSPRPRTVSPGRRKGGWYSPPAHLRTTATDDPRWHPAILPADEWDADSGAVYCKACSEPFTLLLRKHHCRRCGHIYCAECCGAMIPFRHTRAPQRCCRICRNALALIKLQQQVAAEMTEEGEDAGPAPVADATSASEGVAGSVATGTSAGTRDALSVRPTSPAPPVVWQDARLWIAQHTHVE